jgi:hypothetical protein
MHELLAAATGCATPRTWQCMDPCAFALQRREPSTVAVARPMDGLEIRADSPQEDEFALLALGVDSAYRAFWMPHRLAQLQPTLDPAYWLANPQWRAPWETFLRGVLAASPNRDTQPLMLKSPNHTYRLTSIVQRFPATRVVWLLRDPAEVFHSNRKMWTQMFALHGLGPAPAGMLDAFLVRALQTTAQVLRDALARAGDRRWVFVPHTALIERPRAIVDTVIEQLALPRATHSAALDGALQRTAQGRVDRYDDEWPEAARHAAADLRAMHQLAMADPRCLR